MVIANPPYIRQEELSEIKSYLSHHYETFKGTADLYVYFVELAMRNMKAKGQFIFIIPNKWMRAGYGSDLRQFIKSHQVNFIYDFGDLPVFEEATTYPSILSMTKTAPSEKFFAANIETLQYDPGLNEYLHENRFQVNIDGLQDQGWTLTSEEVQNILKKMRQIGTPIGEYVEGKIFYGIKTGLNEAFVIDEETKERLIAEDLKSAEIIKPFLAGRDIKRYETPKADKYLILFKNGQTKEKFGDLSEEDAWKELTDAYPSICNHLIQYKEKAKKRYDQGQYWWELRACDYYKEFEKPKLMLPDIAIKSEALLDNDLNYCVNTVYIIPGLNKYELGIINSKLILFYYANLTQTIRGGYFRFIRQYLEQIPITKPDNIYKLSIEDLVGKVIDLKSQNQDTSALESEIDLMVYKLYGLTYAEVKVVDEGFGMSESDYAAYEF